MKKTKWIYLLILLMPIIDVITSIQSTKGINGLTLSMMVKGILFLFFLFYIFLLSQSKYKKISIIYIFLIGFYVIGYFAFKPDLLAREFIVSEFSNIFRLFFMPVMFLGLLNIFSDLGFDKKKFLKIMGIVLVEYSLLLLIPLLTGNANLSYHGKLAGYMGWFYGGNELSVIVSLLIPFVFYLYNINNKFSFLICAPIFYAIANIGTKVSLLGCLISLILGTLFIFIKEKFKINFKSISAILTLIISFIFFFYINTVTLNNIKDLSDKTGFTEVVKDKKETQKVKQKQDVIEIKEESNNKDASKKEIIKKEQEEPNNEFLDRLVSFLLNHRDHNYVKLEALYNDTYQAGYLLFGMGVSNTSRINNTRIFKTIEIDYLDLYFYDGLLSIPLVLFPYVFTFICAIVYLFKKKTTRECTCNVFLYSAIACMTLGIAAIAGHVLLYPTVTFYVCLYLIFILNESQIFKKNKINNKKVAILSMHMGIGGIENVLVNQANMLSSNYDVEIISLYNNHKDIPYKLNSNIEIKYLSDFISNRDEFNNTLKNKQIINIVKEGFKALKILYLKPLLLKKYIIYSDAKVIISTRKEFSKYLGYYSRPGIVTISEEHNHHNCNKKEINNVIKMNKNVDYLLPASKELVGFYSKLVKPQIVYIPNTIKDNLNKSKCNNKKIVSVGRLSSEKGFDTLISVMRDVIKKDKNITLDIYGDGVLRSVLEETIKELKLTNNVFLKGNISHEDLMDTLSEYSIYVCPSYTESFGLGALEAMNAGLPCIYFDTAKGLNEFCNEDNSICIPKRNIKLMANSIIDLFNDKKKLKQMSKSSINSTCNYYEENVKKIFLDFIKVAIDNSLYKKKRVLFVSSQGGHLNELLQLKSLFNKYTYQIMTEKTATTENLKYQFPNHVKYVPYGTRSHPIPYYLFILPMNLLHSFIYFILFRPHVIITTGAHTAGPMCCVGKLFGSKIIYIESFANITTKTATGRILYHFADVFVVQWEEMKNLYPNSVYGGWIF